MWDNKIFDKALLFSFMAHNGQEMRQPKGEPFAAHIIGVLAGAIKYSIGENIDWNFMVQTALLHDILEDTDKTYEELEKEFGKRVADAVQALTKNEEIVDKMEKMQDSLDRIKTQPREVAMVKLADRIFNLRSKVVDWTPEKQKSYKAEGQLICDELGYASETLRKALQDTIDHYDDC